MMTTQNVRPSLAHDESRGFDWEDAPCPMCGYDHGQVVMQAPDNDRPRDGRIFAVVECSRCRLWYTNPRPTEATIASFYADDYRPHHSSSDRPVKTSLFRQWQSALTGRPCLERHRLPFVGRGRLLDFGCGGGDFLRRMREEGWAVTALDTSSTVINRLRDQFNIEGHVGTLPHPDLRPGRFDVITMWASLEHVHHPLAVLRAVNKLLAPGGRVYLQVHNVDSWARQRFGRHWYSLDLPRHLTHFRADTLTTMLELAGLRVRTMRTLPHPSAIRKSLTLARRDGATTLANRLLGAKPLRLLWSWLGYAMEASDHLFAMAEKT